MALQTKAIVVGAGPVGCYAAARLCQSQLISAVHVYEKQEKIDPLSSAGRNVNVTLCKRGKTKNRDQDKNGYSHLRKTVQQKIESISLLLITF